MKTIKIVVAAFLGLVLCSAAVPEKDDYQTRAEMFLAGIIQKEVDKSYDELFSNSLIASKAQMVKLQKENTWTILNMYGELLGYDFVKQQEYGDSIVRLVYVLKCEQVPVTWEFYFYKPVSDWTLVNIAFDTKYDLLADK
jgi:hypothetical protein